MNNKREAPDFLIVGAAKSGTTILWEWLAANPAVFVPKFKEPHFYCFTDKKKFCLGAELDPFYSKEFVVDRSQYASTWLNVEPNRLCGEASPGYLYFPESAARIARDNPNCRIIAILRKPTDRAFSQFMHHVRDGYEPCLNFESALSNEDARIRAGWWWGYHYKSAGLYYEQWKNYCLLFPREQRLLLLYDDLVENPEKCYRMICEFLQIREEKPDFQRRANQSHGIARVPNAGALQQMLRHGSVVSRVAHQFLPSKLLADVKKQVETLNSRDAPTMSKSSIDQLQLYFEPNIQKLSDLIGRDLNIWLKKQHDR